MDCGTQLWNPSFTCMRWKTEKIMSTFRVTVHHDSQVLLLCLLVLRWWFTAGPWQCFCWLLRMNGSCHAILLPLGRNPRLFITISIQILSIYLTASTVYIIQRVRQICTFGGIEIDICQVRHCIVIFGSGWYCPSKPIFHLCEFPACSWLHHLKIEFPATFNDLSKRSTYQYDNKWIRNFKTIR